MKATNISYWGGLIKTSKQMYIKYHVHQFHGRLVDVINITKCFCNQPTKKALYVDRPILMIILGVQNMNNNIATKFWAILVCEEQEKKTKLNANAKDGKILLGLTT